MVVGISRPRFSSNERIVRCRSVGVPVDHIGGWV